MATTHIPVLLHESVDGLAIVPGDVIVDGTFGGGGHSGLIIEQYKDTVSLVCVDLDEAAKERYMALFGTQTNTVFVQSNFKDAQYIIDTAGVVAKQGVTKVLLDLGTSTFQLLADTRGFSFQSDAPLSMAFSEKGSHIGVSAWDIVNEWAEESIADIIYAYGEDRSSRKIARAIVEARASGPIDTASGLATVILGAFKRRGRIHPATKTFQAFRIAVNDELNVLKEALSSWWQLLAPGGRIAVITFHSLEDRIVKQWMKAQTNERVITKKPLIATTQELQTNPRSRSAKLRIIEKIKDL
jgi:16S rRNA (cytosine1402-N4)-methyltransferase